MQGLTRALLALLAVLMVSLAITPAPSAAAQEQPAATQQAAPPVKIDRRKLLVQPRNKDGTIEEVSFFEDPVLWARDKLMACSTQRGPGMEKQ